MIRVLKKLCGKIKRLSSNNVDSKWDELRELKTIWREHRALYIKDGRAEISDGEDSEDDGCEDDDNEPEQDAQQRMFAECMLMLGQVLAAYSTE